MAHVTSGGKCLDNSEVNEPCVEAFGFAQICPHGIPLSLARYTGTNAVRSDPTVFLP